jgi:amino acid transporter
MYSQQFIITILVLVAAIGSAIGLAIYDNRPRESLNPSMVPAIPLMLVCGLIAILALVHLVNLFGIKTGS